MAEGCQQQLKFAPPAFVPNSRLRPQRSPEAATIVILMQPWLQIPRAGGRDHNSRQKPPLITILMHSSLQFRIAGCDHTGSQQQLKFAPRLQIQIAGCDHTGRQKHLFDARAVRGPSPQQPEARGPAVRTPLIPRALLHC